MKNEEILNKLEEDMGMRGFSKYTKDSYVRKAKDALEYFEGKGREFREVEIVEIVELRKYLMEHLRKEKKLLEVSVNYYNSVIRFVSEVTMDKVINKKQLPMYKKRQQMINVLTKE